MEDNSAAVSGHNLLRNTKIQQYIAFIKNNLEEESGISKLRNLRELAKIAYSNIAHLHDNWTELSFWEEILDKNPDVMSAVESIDTKTETRVYKTDGDDEQEIEVKYVKIKLYSKTTAIGMINEMLGYKMPSKTDITSLGKEITSPFLELMKTASKKNE
jgi:phage terminase small subunit